MRRFRFRLDPVLRLRAHRLERRRLELASAQEELTAVEREVDAIGSALRAAFGAVDGRLQEGVDAGALSSALRSTDLLRARLADCERRRSEAEARVREARERAAGAHAALRALERLRERRLVEHRKAAARGEQRELEEAARLCDGSRRSEGRP
ncbi:MAG: flagellar export protein FliJ [Myxococcota bacterium]